MNDAAKNLYVTITANGAGYRAAMTAAAADTDRFGASVTAADAKTNAFAKTAKTTEGSLLSMSKAAMGAFGGIAFLTAAGAAIKGAGDFQSQITLLSTAAGELPKNLGMVAAGIRKISDETGVSAHNLAEGMYLIEKAGYRGADGLNLLKMAAEGARAENVDMATMTNALTSIMTSYHLKAKDATVATNELVAASGAAKTTMPEFAGSLATVLPIASAAHISFAQVGGAIATLTQHGTSAQEATQELANTIRSLQNPSLVAQKEMQQLGLSVNDVSTGLGKRGLSGTIDLIYNTILHQMGPSGTVLLNSFKQAASASADLQIMLTKMPPGLASTSREFLNGSLSMKDYQKGFKNLSADGYTMGTQFLALVKSSHGFNDVLKSGSPAAQTFSAALAKIMGGATGLNTALQLGGENMGGFKSRVDEVSAAADKNGKDISTWAQTSKNFNVELSQVEQTAINFAQTLATNLMPAITAGAHGFDEVLSVLTQLPHGFDMMAIEVGIAAYAFPKLQAAVRSATVAFQEQQIQMALGRMEMAEQGTAIGKLGVLFTGFGGVIKSLAGPAGLVLLAQGFQHASDGMGTFELAAGGAAEGLALGGPFGAAIGGATGLVVGLGRELFGAGGAAAINYKLIGQTQALHDAKGAVDALGASLDQVTGKYGANTRAAVFNELNTTSSGQAMLKFLQGQGVTGTQAVSAVMGTDPKATAAAQRAMAQLKGQLANAQHMYDLSHDAEVNQGEGVIPQKDYGAFGGNAMPGEATIKNNLRYYGDLVKALSAAQGALPAFQGSLSSASRGIRDAAQASGDLNKILMVNKQTWAQWPKQLTTVIKSTGTEGTIGALDGLVAAARRAGMKNVAPGQAMQIATILVKSDPSIKGTKAEIDAVAKTLEGLNGSTATVNVNANTGGFFGALNALNNLPPAPTVHKADGGLITGPGTGTSDSIHARVSNGEYIIPADSVNHYGLAMFDSLRAKRYAGGGYVNQFGYSEGRYGSHAPSVGHTTVVVHHAAAMPSALTLQVDGYQFTAYVRGHAGDVAQQVVDSNAQGVVTSGRQDWR